MSLVYLEINFSAERVLNMNTFSDNINQPCDSRSNVRPVIQRIKTCHTSTDLSLYQSKLLKLTKSLENEYHPEKDVIFEKTNTQLRVSQSASLYIL